MNIVVFETEAWEKSAFDQVCGQESFETVEDDLTPDNADQYADAEIISVFIYSKLGRKTLEKLDKLRLIATRSTGFDHIDREYCKENGITVCNVPSYGENTVAEHVFALLLTISHHLWEAVDRTRRGDFSLQGLRGFDLQGKTLGVIGTGEIGKNVIRIARGFDMKVLAFDVQPREELTEQYDFDYVELDKLFGEADILTLHVPANDQTRNMINADAFAKMKQGVVLINTSRGSLVNAKALIESLANGKVAAAGLDVLAEEPTIREEAELLRSVFRQEHDLETLLADHLLLRLRNVYITPHSAFDTKEAVHRILDTTVKNITSFCQGEPINVVVQPENQSSKK